MTAELGEIVVTRDGREAKVLGTPGIRGWIGAWAERTVGRAPRHDELLVTFDLRLPYAECKGAETPELLPLSEVAA